MLTVSISSLPLSLLHHHEHANDCDIASSIPNKFKKEKDDYPKHYHTHEADCFLCYENHLSNAKETDAITKTILSSCNIILSEKLYVVHQISIIDLKGRDPPFYSSHLS